MQKGVSLVARHQRALQALVARFPFKLNCSVSRDSKEPQCQCLLILEEKAWLWSSLCSPSSRRCSIGLRSRLCSPGKFSHAKLAHPWDKSLRLVFVAVVLCTGVQSCWNRKGLFWTVSTVLGAWRVPGCLGRLKRYELLSELRSRDPLLKRAPHPSPLHQTSHLAQCSETSTVPLATTKPRQSFQTENRDSSLQSMRLRVSRVQCVHRFIWCFALHLVT